MDRPSRQPRLGSIFVTLARGCYRHGQAGSAALGLGLIGTAVLGTTLYFVLIRGIGRGGW